MLKMATFFVAGEARLPFWDGSQARLSWRFFSSGGGKVRSNHDLL
jgi:hypothetical protein